MYKEDSIYKDRFKDDGIDIEDRGKEIKID